ASASPAAGDRQGDRVTVTAANATSAAAMYANENDNRSLIQAGAGEPAWDVGNNYQLSWSGPVTPEQSMRLVIAPAWLVRWLRVIMLALLVLLLGRMLQSLLKPLQPFWRGW